MHYDEESGSLRLKADTRDSVTWLDLLVVLDTGVSQRAYIQVVRECPNKRRARMLGNCLCPSSGATDMFWKYDNTKVYTKTYTGIADGTSKSFTTSFFLSDQKLGSANTCDVRWSNSCVCTKTILDGTNITPPTEFYCDTDSSKNPSEPNFIYTTNKCEAPGTYQVWLEPLSASCTNWNTCQNNPCGNIDPGSPPADGYWFWLTIAKSGS